MRLFPVLLLVFIYGCVGAGGHDPDWARARQQLLWPEPPAPPRIQFLRSIQAADDLAGKEQGGKVFSWLTGEKNADIRMLTPYGIAVDGDGRMWVADTEGRAVQMIDLARKRVESWRRLGEWTLLSPVGIARDPRDGKLYVSDSGLRRVFVTDKDLKFVRLLDPPGGFRRPTGLAVAPDGRVYVADTLAHIIKIFAADGRYLGEQKSGLTADGLFSLPGSLAVDRSGRLFVVDTMNFRIEYFSPDGTSLGSIGQLGDVPGSFARPRGVAVDSAQHVYVTDAAFDNVQVFDLAGRLLLGWGGPGNVPGKFNMPAGMVFDDSDRLYVVDSFNHRVQMFQYLGD
ncbi:SMP-30/gluconolactonase/LRE family protein [Geothermobacter hydrogeniphilus]|uniref:NHL repeat-containing protein n=1 Tax=Geothermobacter hydrogeniphilus TaxID=1969733 RepID=A0A1X0YD59_9BACT|nr:hypothetical protein [Geothermobacter hydrogeniphilus]ORJ63125.1 hypothetical protein B5V00_02340 [Geothermobacter hydrogeniphilus]